MSARIGTTVPDAPMTVSEAMLIAEQVQRRYKERDEHLVGSDLALVVLARRVRELSVAFGVSRDVPPGA